MTMDLKCSVFHTDEALTGTLKQYIEKVPFLQLCGTYTNVPDALNDYQKQCVHLYFVGLPADFSPDVDGLAFARMLSADTRVVFIADNDSYAATCFRLDALDYLSADMDFAHFLQAVNRAARWFSLMTAACGVKPCERAHKSFFLKANSCLYHLNFDDVSYIEGCGDYVKVHCVDMRKPLLSLCTMKNMEENLPSSDFIRIHRSYIVRKDSIEAISRSMVIVGKRELPVGEAYRESLKEYIAAFMVM